MAGGDPSRPQVAPDHVTADPDLLGDVGEGPPLPAQRDDRRDFVVEQRHAPGLLGRGQFAAVLRPTRVMGDIGALRQRQFGALFRAHRAALAARGLDGFIVPRADEHQGEYVPPRGQRLAWLTGFTGSAGLAIVLRERAALFVDGRYTLQDAAQVDTGLVEIHHLIDEPPTSWIGTALAERAVLGYDPWLHTPHDVERFRAAAENGITRFRASVLADNRRMLDLLVRHADVLERTVQQGVADLLLTPKAYRPRTVSTGQ